MMEAELMDVYANLKSGMTAEKSSESNSLDRAFEKTLATVADSVVRCAGVASSPPDSKNG